MNQILAITEKKQTCILSPTGRLILSKRNKPIFVLIMYIQLPLCPMHHFPYSMLQVPLRQLVLSHKPISRLHIDPRK